MFKRAFPTAVVFLLLSGCVSYQTSAPVKDVNTHRVGKMMYHRVQQGETLYAVAWRYEMDYRTLARLNHLKAPYSIFPGENLQISGKVKPAPVTKKVVTEIQPAKSKPQVRQKPVHVIVKKKTTVKKMVPRAQKVERAEKQTHGHFASVRYWRWPIHGSVVKAFSFLNKGIDISGVKGAKVRATASGQVVYAGNGIRGYGNLIILKHNVNYLSAYAYNRYLFVKSGDWVKSGQIIAEIGSSGTRHYVLHFEIRYKGKPVNPLQHLRR